MTKTLRMKIAYWFFLVIGIAGISMQTYKYFTNELPLTFAQGAVTVFFGMFIFKPMLILDLFTDIRAKILGNKN